MRFRLISLLFSTALATSACTGEQKTDPKLKSMLLETHRLIPAEEAYYRSDDIQFVCISSGIVRPDDHIRALQTLGYFSQAPKGEPFKSKTFIGEFTYDITVFSKTDFQVYVINAKELGWPHSSVGCYHGAEAQIGLMDLGSGLRIVTAGRRVHERDYWRD